MYRCIVGKSAVSLSTNCHFRSLVYFSLHHATHRSTQQSCGTTKTHRRYVSLGMIDDDLLGLALESPSIVKSRKRTRKVLHPIATDTDIERNVSCSSPTALNDSVCASPARRARLLNPGTLNGLRSLSPCLKIVIQSCQLLKWRSTLTSLGRYVVERRNVQWSNSSALRNQLQKIEGSIILVYTSTGHRARVRSSLVSNRSARLCSQVKQPWWPVSLKRLG